MTKARTQREGNAEKCRQYRANASEEKKAEWRHKRRENDRKKRERQKADQERKEAERVRAAEKKRVFEKNHRAYIKAKQKKCQSVPTTPRGKVKLINTIITNATPNTSVVLLENNLENPRGRTATKAIVKATSYSFQYKYLSQLTSINQMH